MKKEKIAIIAFVVVVLAIIVWPSAPKMEETPMEQEEVETVVQAPRSEASVIGNSSFKLVSYDGNAFSGDYALIFTNGYVSAKFCNTLSGSYTMKDGIIKAPALISTKMFCETPARLMQAEGAFASMLAAGAGISLKNDTLVIANGGHTLVFQKN